MINLEDGSRLAGDKAPLKKDLDAWLDQHPGYVIDRVDDELEEGEIVSLTFHLLSPQTMYTQVISVCLSVFIFWTHEL